MRLQPIGDRVMIRRNKGKGETDSGIILPDRTQQRERQRSKTGEVLAIGPGKINPKTGDRKPVETINVGDTVFFSIHAGEEQMVDGEMLLFLHAEEVIGVL